MLPIEKIYGVGKVTAQRMHELGLRTCQDIQEKSIQQLSSWFGKRGEDLYNMSRGIDTRPVRTNIELKSISVEETYSKNRESLDECLKELTALFEDWIRRVDRNNARDKIKNISVKLRYHDFKITTHEVTLKTFPELNDFKRLVHAIWNKRAEPVRLIGIGCHLKIEKPISENSDSTVTDDPDQLNFAI